MIPGLARSVATLGGVGYLRPAPGTWGSAAALPLAWLVHGIAGFPGLALATAAAFAAGLWAIRTATRDSGDHDPPQIVVDELVGQWIALWPLSAGLWATGAAPWVFPWPGWVGGFVLFRLFDIWKPWLIGRADRRRDPLGTMLDDVLAGAAAAIVLTLAAIAAHGWILAR